MTETEMILQAIEGFKNEVKEEFKKVDNRLDNIEERLETLEEEGQITRTATNVILEEVEGIAKELKIRGIYNPRKII